MWLEKGIMRNGRFLEGETAVLLHKESDVCFDCLFPSEPMEEDVFIYLDVLRDTGETNMFGARPYLEQEFGFEKREAETSARTRIGARPTRIGTSGVWSFTRGLGHHHKRGGWCMPWRRTRWSSWRSSLRRLSRLPRP